MNNKIVKSMRILPFFFIFTLRNPKNNEQKDPRKKFNGNNTNISVYYRL